LNAEIIGGCKGETAIDIPVYRLPFAELGNYKHICTPGDSLLIELGGMFSPDAKYLWSNGDTTSSILITKGGEYWVKIIDHGCEASTTTEIEERPFPIFSLGGDTTVCSGTEIVLDSELPQRDGFNWSPNGENSRFITVNSAGTYTLVADLNECEWTESVKVRIELCQRLELPTAFAPESVSNLPENKVFRPIFPGKAPSNNELKFEMFIYDKWGKQVFYTDDIEKGWDGKHNNQDCQGGVYIYRIVARDRISGYDISMGGTVVLIR
jgi:gliding motility-associated-like protein